MSSKPIQVALNALDHLPPPNYANAIFYLPLKAGVSPEQAFSLLQEGLHRTFDQLPWLDGKVFPVSPGAPDYHPGLLEVRLCLRDADGPPRHHHQLRSNELHTSETYEELQESAFNPDTFADGHLTWAPFVPDVTNGAEVFVAQANFVKGACILTAAVCHAVSDGTGMNYVLNIWADNCRDVGLGHVPQPLAPDTISNHDLVERTWAEEGTGRSVEHIPAETWRLLGLEPPQPLVHARALEPATTNGKHASEPRRVMKSYMFYLSPANVVALRNGCIKEPGAVDVSVNDVICALVWRCLLKARTTAKEKSSSGGRAALQVTSGDATDGDNNHNNNNNNMQARLDLPFDVRPYFPGCVPANYLGNFTMINQARVPLSYLVAPSTTIGSVARSIRQVAGEVDTARLMDAYTLAKTLPGLQPDAGPKLQNLEVDGTGLMITSLLAFSMGNLCFSDTVFANGGRPEAIRPLLGAINAVFRYCAILPRKAHGGVEFVANLFDEEMELLMEDEEFGKYAMFLA